MKRDRRERRQHGDDDPADEAGHPDEREGEQRDELELSTPQRVPDPGERPAEQQRPSVDRCGLVRRVRKHPGEDRAIAKVEQAEPACIDAPARGRLSDQAEHRQQLNRAERNRESDGSAAEHESPTRARVCNQDRHRTDRDGDELLRAREPEHRDAPGEDHRLAGGRSLAQRTGRREAGRHPRRRREQGRRLGPGDEVRRGCERERRHERGKAIAAHHTGEAVGTCEREQVVEREPHHGAGCRREHPERDDRRQVEDARLRVSGKRRSRQRVGIPERQMPCVQCAPELGPARGEEPVGVVRVRQQAVQQERRERDADRNRCQAGDGKRARCSILRESRESRHRAHGIRLHPSERGDPALARRWAEPTPGRRAVHRRAARRCSRV